MEADLACNNTSVETDLFNHEYDYRLNWTTQSSVTNNSNHNDNRICDILVFFFNQNTRNFESFFANSEKKIGSVESCTVQLLRHDSYIRTVDSQSDLRILL